MSELPSPFVRLDDYCIRVDVSEDKYLIIRYIQGAGVRISAIANFVITDDVNETFHPVFPIDILLGE